MTMSQVEDIQLASECMGLTVTREGRARVRVNLEIMHTEKTAMELGGGT